MTSKASRTALTLRALSETQQVGDYVAIFSVYLKPGYLLLTFESKDGGTR